MRPNPTWIRKRRQELLSKTSDAEKCAFTNLRKLGFTPMRQFPIWTGRKMYFADLYIPQYRIVFEIDGGYHYTERQKRLDGNRSSGLWRLGFHVVRLSNHDARNADKVRAKIRLIASKKPPIHRLK